MRLPTNNPKSNLFYFVDNGLKSDYDSSQVQFRRRLSRGLTVLASYTWSHCIDYGSQNYLLAYQRATAISTSGTIFPLHSPMICRTWT